MATNYVRCSYTEIIDLQTVNGQTSIIGIHTPTGKGPYEKMAGLFMNYRKYRYKGISRILMVPAAQLPVDPLGLTGVQGTTDLMDPRDSLNPVMFHGAHGENMSNVIDNFYANHGTGIDVSNGGPSNPSAGFVSTSADKVDTSNPVAENNYYRFLTDPKWRKFGIQSGVKLSHLTPLTWRLSRSMPLLPGYSDPEVGILRTGSDTGSGITDTAVVGANVPTYPSREVPAIQDVGGGGFSRAFVQEFTNGVSRLGWLPTTTYGAGADARPTVTILPKLFMGILVLPPAYNVEQFFRLSIRHVFEFKDFTMSLGLMGRQSMIVPETPNISDFTGYYNWIDYTTDPTGKTIGQVSDYHEGTTLDCIGASSEVVSDGLN